MRIPQFLLLTICIALGVLWVFIGQNWMLLTIFPGILVGPGLKLQNFLQTGSSPAFTVLWAGCITALLIWLSITWTSRPKSSAQTRAMQPMWWISAALLGLFGWLCMGWFVVFKWQVTGTSALPGQTFYPIPPGGWLVLIVFVLVDVILLYWLPTLLASPRNYRLVVPGAVTILGSR